MSLEIFGWSCATCGRRGRIVSDPEEPNARRLQRRQVSHRVGNRHCDGAGLQWTAAMPEPRIVDRTSESARGNYNRGYMAGYQTGQRRMARQQKSTVGAEKDDPR